MPLLCQSLLTRSVAASTCVVIGHRHHVTAICCVLDEHAVTNATRNMQHKHQYYVCMLLLSLGIAAVQPRVHRMKHSMVTRKVFWYSRLAQEEKPC